MSHNKNPFVSVVILNWNGIENTLVCIDSVKKLKYKPLEIIVVDNGSTDGSVERLEKVSNITLVKNTRNLGFTGGHIEGLRQSNGEYIVLLNNDAVLKSDYVARAVSHFESDARVGAVGGKAYWWDEDNPVYDDSNQFYSYQSINPVTAEAISNQTDEGHVREVNNVSGSCVVVRRSVIDKVGYLYDPFFAYYEETDLFARMKRVGYKVLYDPQLAIWHKNGKSSSSYFQYYQIFKNRFLFAVRNFDAAHLPIFIKSYVKTGLISSVHRFRKSSNQELHRAFSNAFIANLISWPACFISRYKLRHQLRLMRPTSYNKLIVIENSGVSICLDWRGKSEDVIIDLFSSSKKSLDIPFNFQIVILHNLPKPLKIQGAHCVQDKGFFGARGINFGWLSAKWDHLLFSDMLTPIDVASMREALWEAYKYNRWIILPIHQKRNVDKTTHFGHALVQRTLLINYGGFERSATQELSDLAIYAKFWNKRKLCLWKSPILIEASHTSQPMTTRKSVKDLEIKARRDADEFKSLSIWQQYLERHYRIYQMRNIIRWYLSPKISLRLRLARTKNLILAAAALRRERFATELKHIRNEYLRIIKNYFSVEEQNKEIKESLKHIARNNQNVPVFIICRDRLSPLLKLTSWLENQSLTKIVLIDNDSLFPPLIKYYEQTKYQVLATCRNVGHTSPWTSGIVKALCPGEFYIVTDPDIIPSEDCPDDVIQHFFDLHAKYFDYQKVGFGLKIDDLPDHYSLKPSVIEWEAQFWKSQLEPGVYEAGIDTTFALYKPHTYKYMLHPSIRTGEPYTARHLPWYVDAGKIDPEERFYRDHASSKITSWSGDQLPERYQKELA